MVSPELIVVKRWTWKQFLLLTVAVVLLLMLFLTSGYLLGNADGVGLRNKNQELFDLVQERTIQLEQTKRALVMQKQISKVDFYSHSYRFPSLLWKTIKGLCQGR